jgi:phospholipid/cholesterol/gamma-HCH transport system ATP-binding protein
MISIKNIKKSFADLQVLNDVNLEIKRGESLVILGASGCGKSVLLKLMMALLIPDAGQIIINGKNVYSLTRKELYKLRTRFGMLFQGAALFDSMNVFENVTLPLTEHTDKTLEEKKANAAQRLNLVGLPGIEHKFPSELSGGMKKRVGLARALCMNPDFVLYDEPTTGLDPISADKINDLITELNHKLSITSIAVTHDLYSAFKIGDRFAMLAGGVIEFVGTKEELQSSTNPIIREFLSHQ